MTIFLNWYRRLSEKLDTFIVGEKDFERAKHLIPFFYYFAFFIAFGRLEGLDHAIARPAETFDPRMIIFWAKEFDFATTTTVIFFLTTLTSLAAAVFPFSRTARIGMFVGILQYHAYAASFGGPNHQWDHWLWVSFILIFLPTLNEAPELEVRRRFSLTFWCAQAWLLLTYSMAGIGKLIYIFVQISQGQVHGFSPDAGSLYAATQLNAMGITNFAGSIIIANPMLAWIPFLVMLELQTLSILIAFRPDLHRLWGAGLLLFHVSTLATMRAVFVGPSALIMLLLLASPFQSSREDKRPTALNFFTGKLKIFGRK
ncbi:MAG: hypothetical protein RIQ56_663 [Candidatus Parcubacteria bacterium]|jgi:hypothetical protein